MSEINPFSSLPWPSPGDRIKSEDFRVISQALSIVNDTYALSAEFFGRTFGELKLALSTQQFQIQRVMSVFGTELNDLSNASLDNRKVIQVMPTVLGERQILVVLTESVDSRRFAPNLIGLTYGEALELMKARFGDITISGAPPIAPQYVGHSLSELQQNFTK